MWNMDKNHIQQVQIISWVGNLFYNYSNKKNRVLLQYRYLQRNWFQGNMVSISSNHTVEPDVDTRSEDSNFLCYFQALGSYNISEFIKFQIRCRLCSYICFTSI